VLGGGHRRRVIFNHDFEEVISVENLLGSWKEFLKGKRTRKDVQIFSLDLMENIIGLHQDLSNYQYCHGLYQAFRINDPKPRQIHKSSVRDRLLHRAVYRFLYPFFDRLFISDSFSCRLNKGTHKAINRFRAFAYKVSLNNTRTTWILKCDISKFFENINHKILLDLLGQYILDKDVISLLTQIVKSFSYAPNRGLPLGNLTSQLLVNIYMNEFDQFVKYELKVKYYIRYADDFTVFSRDKSWLEELLPRIDGFLTEKLKLTLHPSKISIRTLASGVDFLGWVQFSDHRVLRTSTKRRMFKKLDLSKNKNTLNSYLGLLKYGHTHKLRKRIYEKVNIDKA